MALLIGQGTPSDTNTGANGDFYADTQNRFYWGPKANGSWVGTQASLTGPTGPGLLYGKGSPSASTGSIGQGYMDLVSGASWLKVAAGWSQVAGSPFQGPQGPVGTVGLNLGSVAFTTGQQSGFTTATTTTANQVLPIPGTNVPQVFVPQANCSYAGYTYLIPGNSGQGATFNLYDQTAGSIVYQGGAIPTGTISTSDKRNSSIGLVAGNQHVWRTTAATNLLCTVTPYYFMPATSNIGTSVWPMFGLSSDVSFTTTDQVLRAVGSNVSTGPVNYFILPKAAYLQYVTVQTTGSASLTLTLKTGSTSVYTVPATVSSGNTPYTTTALQSSDVPLAAATQYLWYAKGSGSGQVYITMTYGN